jgi:hypothetical protein
MATGDDLTHPPAHDMATDAPHRPLARNPSLGAIRGRPQRQRPIWAKLIASSWKTLDSRPIIGEDAPV